MVNLRIAQYALTVGLLMLGVAAMIPKPAPSPAWIAARNGSSVAPNGSIEAGDGTMLANQPQHDPRYRTAEGDRESVRLQLAERPERSPLNVPSAQPPVEKSVPFPLDLPLRE